ISGLAGLGVYFLERDHLEGMVAVVVALAARADPAWRTTPALLPPDERDAWPDGTYDCGVAHGNAGVIGVLGPMAARGVPRAAPLCEAGGRWLAAQRANGRLPARRDGVRREAARTAWCYGEPGAIAALWGHADVGDPTAWIDAPVGVTDAGLCHG